MSGEYDRCHAPPYCMMIKDHSTFAIGTDSLRNLIGLERLGTKFACTNEKFAAFSVSSRSLSRMSSRVALGRLGVSALTSVCSERRDGSRDRLESRDSAASALARRAALFRSYYLFTLPTEHLVTDRSKAKNPRNASYIIHDSTRCSQS